jgi:hypothetical protein
MQTLRRIRNDGYRDTNVADSVKNETEGTEIPWKARKEPLPEPAIFSTYIAWMRA